MTLTSLCSVFTVHCIYFYLCRATWNMNFLLGINYPSVYLSCTVTVRTIVDQNEVAFGDRLAFCRKMVQTYSSFNSSLI